MSDNAKVYLEKPNSKVGGQTKICIEVEKIEENIQNQSIKISLPQISESNQNANVPITKFKDLKRLVHVYTIQGKITDQTSMVQGSEQKLTAFQAKNALIYYILYTYGNINFYWRGVANDDAIPSSSVSVSGSLMLGYDKDRFVTTVFDKVAIGEDPALRSDFGYTVADGYVFEEINAKSYRVIVTLTKGVNF